MASFVGPHGITKLCGRNLAVCGQWRAKSVPERNELTTLAAEYAVGELDHVALTCRNVDAMVDFYTRIIGLKPERLDLFNEGKVPFPSVRINAGTIIDFFPASRESEAPTLSGTAHYCINFPEETYYQTLNRLEENGFAPESKPKTLSGARGNATAIYYRDPDNNRLELRYYSNN